MTMHGRSRLSRLSRPLIVYRNDSRRTQKWFAFGSGVGIEIAGPAWRRISRVTAVRVRPTGARVIGQLVVDDFPHQPAGVWGTDYAAFLRKLDLRMGLATVLLPRQDVIVRQLALPGVSDKDLASAVRFQLDGLHPYPEDDVIAELGASSGHSAVLVAIARRAVIDRYATMFAEAGIKIGCFTCSAAAIYSALRLFGTAPPAELLAYQPMTAMSNSTAKAPRARSFPRASTPREPRAAALACAELRIDRLDRAPRVSRNPFRRARSALRRRARFGVSRGCRCL